MVCDLLWTPFDVRFKDLLTQLEYHKELVTSELILANARASKDIQKALEYEQKLAAKERSNAEKARKQLDQLSALSEEMKLDLERKNKGELFYLLVDMVKISYSELIFKELRSRFSEGSSVAVPHRLCRNIPEILQTSSS